MKDNNFTKQLIKAFIVEYQNSDIEAYLKEICFFCIKVLIRAVKQEGLKNGKRK